MLILCSSLMTTAFVTLPRIGFWFQIQKTQPDITLHGLDFVLRSVYAFVLALLFFLLNLEVRQIRIAGLTIPMETWYQRLIVNIAVLVVASSALIELHLALFDPYLHERFFKALMMGTNTLVMVLSMLGSSIYTLIQQKHQVELENLMLQHKEAEMRYSAVKHQLNPHFLFNTFNTLTALITSDAHAALRLVDTMAEVYRYVLRVSSENLTTVAEELRFAAAYADMLTQRYADKLTVAMQVDASLYAGMVPPLAVQMLIENAVKHNVVSRKRPLRVEVYSSNDGAIVVSNNLQRRTGPRTSNGMGLYHLNERYRYLCGTEIHVQETTDTFRVTVPVIAPEEPGR
ncbi:histidine kinase [Rhodocaloribacter litoris]|uniref:sensor histidine kinase n=1 Tax=Rhodocaloribacter litoris TaxID=2558931 RepID=UPI00141DAC05|nr:histidine kinase [Rhodocaloribacter litoris]QXD14134.1 histidine kinase [Rhodocaloribacter litoris]